MSLNRSAVVLWLAATLALEASSARGDSATWNLDPATNDWNTASNWTPATVPRTSADTASFGVSHETNPSLSIGIDLGQVFFNPGASAYTITFDHGRTLNFYGTGVMNNSGITQTFVLEAFRGVIAQMVFHNSASAGDETLYTVDGPSLLTSLLFLDNSSAGVSTITLTGGSDIYGSHLQLAGSASAGQAAITNDGGGASGAQGASTTFFDQTTADGATIIAHGGAVSGAGGALIVFATSGSPNAGNATLIADGNVAGADGGLIEFLGTSDGGHARIELFDRGTLSLASNGAVVTVGSLEGNGTVLLGTNNLTVGLTNRNTTFSGTIRGDAGGSLTKDGVGRFTLNRGSAYPGGTLVAGGELALNNRSGSATGSGLVQVEKGILSGRGVVAGGVVLATNGGSGTLSPGSGRPPSVLTIKSFLTLHSNAVDQFIFDSSTAQANMVIAGAIDLDFGSQISFRDLGDAPLPIGTVFTVISSTVADPIFGHFDNLPDGGTVTVNGNKFLANYEGGDGNDLTLTVVPQ